MTDYIDGIIAGMSEAQKRAATKLGPAWGLLPGDNMWPLICYDDNILGEDVDWCLRNGIYSAKLSIGGQPTLIGDGEDVPDVEAKYALSLTPLGLAVRARLEASNG